MADEPAWCDVHQHHKWCEHNGGAMDAAGEWGPRPEGVFTPAEPYDESMTSTLMIPFQRHIFEPEIKKDMVAIPIPDGMAPPPPESPATNPQISLFLLGALQETQEREGMWLRLANFWVTRDEQVVTQRMLGDGCPECLQGIATVLTAMRELDDHVVAVGELSWAARG